jgi:hypothetical protein
LYLNRRASLEAWDLEIQLRQITRPAAVKARPFVAHTLALAAAVLLAFSLGSAPDARATAPGAPAPAPAPAIAPAPAQAPAPASNKAPAPEVAKAALQVCVGPKLEAPQRAPAASAHQAQVRKQLDQVYAHKDLRGFECIETWQMKPSKKKDKDKKKDKKKDSDLDFLNGPRLDFLASVFKIIFIALAIGGVAFLLYRYRDHFPSFERRPGPLRATEVGGLDIRAESLPPDVTTEVRALWARGERRLALALLYRATLSRLVSDDGLKLRQGDTEGDCLRAAGEAHLAARLSQGRLDVARAATNLWLGGAYGDRWPDDATLNGRCAEWETQFGAAMEKRA